MKPSLEKIRARSVRDSKKIRTAPIEKIDAILARRGFDPPCPLWEHQRRAAAIGTKARAFQFTLDMGMGKTRTTLALIDYWKKRGEVRQAFVVAPYTVILNEWRKEAAHFPDLTVEACDFSGPKNDRIFRGDTDVIVLTSSLLLAKLGRRSNSKVDAEEATLEFLDRCQMLVVDESLMLANSDTEFWRFAHETSDSIPFRYLLSGTPNPGREEGVWAQSMIVDHGHALGESLQHFRAAWCSKKPNRFRKWSWDYDFRSKLTQEFQRRTRHFSIRFTMDEFKEVPPMIGGLTGGSYVIKETPLRAQAAKDYADSKEREDVARKQYGNSPELEQVLAEEWRNRRRITSGYHLVEEEDFGFDYSAETAVQEFEAYAKQPKLELLDAIIDAHPTQKLLVAVQYRETAAHVSSHLARRGSKFVAPVITSATTKKGRIERIELFKTRKSCRVLLGTTAISTGTNLGEASILVFYESPPDYPQRMQFERRVLRGTTRKSPLCVDLAVAESVDLKILAKLLSRKQRIDAQVED